MLIHTLDLWGRTPDATFFMFWGMGDSYQAVCIGEMHHEDLCFMFPGYVHSQCFVTCYDSRKELKVLMHVDLIGQLAQIGNIYAQLLHRNTFVWSRCDPHLISQFIDNYCLISLICNTFSCVVLVTDVLNIHVLEQKLLCFSRLQTT